MPSLAIHTPAAGPVDDDLEAVERAVELARTLRSQAGLRTRQPLARLWIALPGSDHPELEALLKRDEAEADKFKVEGTPTFFVNGYQVEFDNLESALKGE